MKPLQPARPNPRRMRTKQRHSQTLLPNPKTISRGSGSGFSPKNRSGLNSNGFAYVSGSCNICLFTRLDRRVKAFRRFLLSFLHSPDVCYNQDPLRNEIPLVNVILGNDMRYPWYGPTSISFSRNKGGTLARDFREKEKTSNLPNGATGCHLNTSFTSAST